VLSSFALLVFFLFRHAQSPISPSTALADYINSVKPHIVLESITGWTHEEVNKFVKELLDLRFVIRGPVPVPNSGIVGETLVKYYSQSDEIGAQAIIKLLKSSRPDAESQLLLQPNGYRSGHFDVKLGPLNGNRTATQTWAYYGERKPSDKTWFKQNFRELSGDSAATLRPGDIVVATRPVNVHPGPPVKLPNGDFEITDPTGELNKDQRIQVLEISGPYPGDGEEEAAGTPFL
jgi:hypothetical protein